MTAAFEIPFNSCGTGGQPPSSSICPESNVQHWDKIIFMIIDPELAKRVNLTANTELDIKVLDDPHTVADIKHKVLDFLNQSNASPKAIQIMQVEYAIICASQSISTHGEKLTGFAQDQLALPNIQFMKNITVAPTMSAIPKR
ncbi:MAG: hypothetical protein ACHQXG_03275 [Nitrososphaerales archaeon]